MATVDKGYIYSLGRVKELEKGLLIEANLDRVLESDDPGAVLRSISFFKAVEEYEGRDITLDDMFLCEREYNRRQLHELVAESPLEDVFLLPYDIQNVKLFLKGKLASIPAIKDLPVEEGKFRKTELVEAIYDEVPTDVPIALMDEVAAIVEKFQNTRSFALVDTHLDRYLRKIQVAIAQKAKSPFTVEYFRRLSDVQNIATMVRWKVQRLGRESLVEVLFDTGTLATSFFERIYDSGWESMVTALKPTDYGDVVAKAFAQIEQEGFLPFLDVCLTNYMIEFLQKTKQFTFGIEQLLAYYLARDHELKLVRIVLTGKRFLYPQTKLQLRMKELYS